MCNEHCLTLFKKNLFYYTNAFHPILHYILTYVLWGFCEGTRSLAHMKIRGFVGVVFVKFWILWRYDDGLADGPKLVNWDKCKFIVQHWILNIFIEIWWV